MLHEPFSLTKSFYWAGLERMGSRNQLQTIGNRFVLQATWCGRERARAGRRERANLEAFGKVLADQSPRG